MNFRFRRRVGLAISLPLLVASMLVACSGETGSQGPPGDQGPQGDVGPVGPTGSPGGLPIDSADNINIAVSSVAVPSGGGAPVVQFKLTNDLTQGLTGLPAGDIRFTLSQLSPAAAGSGASSEWQSYVTRDSGGIADAQANTETATAGAFVDNGDGTYQYTFAMALTDYPAGPTYDETKSHRLGIEIRGQAPISSNGIHDFLPTGGAPTFTRDIVDNDTCFACHDAFGFHGGPRVDVTYCVTCHNPNSIDGDTATEAWGGSIDMKALVHKIHYGINLTEGYFIVGYRGAVHDYSDIVFPQDVRNCQTCHEESDPNTPDASNWRTVQNRASCGTCHDDIDWANAGHPGGITFQDDTQCVDCHGEDSTVANGDLRVAVVHAIPEVLAGAQFSYNILNITNTAVGENPVIEFSVTDPTNNDAPYDIQNDPEWTSCFTSRLAIGIAWDTGDYNNVDSGNAPGLPLSMNPLSAPGCFGTSTALGNGVFSVTSPVAIPATASGSLAVTMDGHPAVDINGTLTRIAVTNAVAYGGITDTTPVPRRNVVSIERCDDCHSQLALHGNNRTDNVGVCVTCHAPNVTDINQRAAGQCLADLGADDQSVDLKYMIHAIHASGETGVPFEVCGFGNSAHVFDFNYPGKLNNCEGCHEPGSYYPVNPANVLGTTVDVGADPATPTDDVVISPNSAVCSSCHVSNLAKTHMQQNGGDFAATKAADGTLISASTESCELCHGPGRSADVGVMHGVGEFQ
jgi:OmcA/MtrC family decaheme c-type cytochrome